MASWNDRTCLPSDARAQWLRGQIGNRIASLVTAAPEPSVKCSAPDQARQAGTTVLGGQPTPPPSDALLAHSWHFAGCTMGRAYALKSEPMHRQQLRWYRRFSQPDHVFVMSEEEHLAAFGHAAQNTHGRKRPCIVEVQKKIVGHEG